MTDNTAASAWDNRYKEFLPEPRDTGHLPGAGQFSKLIPEEYQDEDGNWRVRIKAQRTKFDEEAKGIFLSTYSETGRFEHSANSAGVTGATVRNHMKKDDEFAEALLVAQGAYRDKVIAHHQNLIFNGTEKETYDRNGNLVSKETQYPVRLIELELKKVDEDYRDKREVDLTVGGGVMITPPEVGSIEDWKTKYGPRTIEGVASEVVDDQSGGEEGSPDEAE